MKYANGHTRVNHAYSARDYSNGTRIHVRPRRELTREPSGGEWIVYLENKLVSAQKKMFINAPCHNIQPIMFEQQLGLYFERRADS